MHDVGWGGLGFAAGILAAIVASQLWPKLTPAARIAWVAVAGAVVSALLVAALQTEGQGKIAATSAKASAMCMGLAADFQQTSSRWALASWTLGLVAALLSAVGGLVGRGADGEKRWYRVGAGMLLATVGSSLSATAAYSVARSNAASTAAAAATTALASSDRQEQYRRCLLAKAQWLESRTDSLDQTPPSQPKASRARPETKRRAKRAAADAGAP